MLNKVQLIGNLGADPESRFLASGDQVVTLNLATTRRWKDKAGERKEETEWHRISIFGKLAEIAAQYLHKGSKCYIEGRIKTSKYQKDGVDVYSTGIIGEQMVMLDSRGDQDSGQQPRPAQQPAAQRPQAPSYDNFDDDIPFNSLNWQIRAHLI